MKLNTLQIYNYLKKDHFTKKTFKKVIAKNELPNRITYPSAYVINTHKNYQPGQHWLAVFFNKNKECDFFDSYGMSPKYYGLEKFIKKHSTNFNYNNLQFQSNYSFYCGYYCIYFILLKCRGLSLTRFQKFFSNTDFNFNDSLIKNLI